MRVLFKLLFFLISFQLFSQVEKSVKRSSFIITPEILVGMTAEANENFPEHDLFYGFALSVGWEQDKYPQEWSQRLNTPRLGLGLAYSNFGNKDSLGYALSFMPFIEFKAFKKEKLKISIGSGATYFNKIYDPISNPNNKAVSTDLSWALRVFMNYKILSGQQVDWKIGGGYFHHSNGHTRLPNQGYNSFLFSISTDIKNQKTSNSSILDYEAPVYSKSKYDYISFRTGLGLNVLSRSFNDKKGVYTLAGEYGKVFNNTFKLGVGFYYRFYQTYYDYIVDNESLVQEGREFDYFTENPWRYATNIGLSLNGEILFGHFGADFSLGINIHKPAYAIDWRINQGWEFVPREIPEQSNIVLGDTDETYYKFKHLLATRIGLKYYLINTNKAPKNNIFIGAHINANLGQADFTEINIGYVHSFKFKN